MDQIIAAYLASGGAVTRCAMGANSGITKREWDRRVRGEAPEVEIERAPAATSFHLRAGFGAR